MSFQKNNKAACKPIKTCTMSCRIPEALAERVFDCATRQNLRLNRYIWLALEKAVQDQGKS